MQINSNIILFLDRMKKKYELEKNKGKVFGYVRAISSLRAFQDPITDVE